MHFREWIQRLETRVQSAVMQEAQAVVEELRARTPPNRQKTRRAAKAKGSGRTSATVELDFSEEYPGTRTTTHRMFRTNWAAIRPKAKQRLIQRLQKAINE
jgi:hypothetical protein